MRLAEGVLDNDVEDSLAHTVLAINKISVEECLRLCCLLNYDLARRALVDGLLINILRDRLHREDHLP